MAISERLESSVGSGAGPRPAPMGLVGAVALVAVVIAGVVGGVFTAQAGFADGGAVARWGVPLARTVVDVAASVTIGLLLLAGTIVPERTSTDRRRAACRMAVVSGSVWVVALLALLALSVSNLSGVHVGDPSFGAQVASVMWSFDYFRVIVVSAIVATAATALAAGARTPTSITWAAVLSLLSLAILALIGHAAGAVAHDTAVNSIAVHMAAAAVWMGGLVALLVLRPLLGSDLGVVVQRYSHLALWAYGGVAVSGVLNATLRISDPAGLLTPYGLLLLVKVAAFVALGVAGWRMRSALVARVSEGDTGVRPFVRLAALETTTMALAMGIAVALSRTAPPVPQTESADIVTSLTGYPDPGGPIFTSGWFPVWRAWLFTWRIDWLFFAAAILGVGLYVAGVRRLRLRGDSWPWHRTLMWVLGWASFVWITSGAPGVYGKVTFSGHMVMHMSLTMLAPIILAFGAPLTLASRALKARRDKTMGPREILLATAHSRWMNFWANPVVAGFNFAGSLYIFYFTPLFRLALTTHVGHVAMVIHFMLAGYVFAWSLIGVDPGPRRWPYSLRLVLLFATLSFHAFFGIIITSTTDLLGGDFFSQLALPWVGDLHTDQWVGGLITWGIGEFPLLVLALLTAVAWMRSDEHEARRKDRQAVRDHDAELEAYNEALRQRAEVMRRTEEAEEARHRARHAHQEGHRP